MAKRRVHIENLKVKLPKGMSGNARDLAAAIGREIMENLAGEFSAARGKTRIDEVSAGKVTTNAMSGETQKRVARAVAAEIGSKLGKRF